MATNSGEQHRTGLPQAEGEPLLEDDDERARRKAATLRSLQTDVGRAVVYNVRLSRLYVVYCLLISLLTASLVIFMIVHVETTKSPIPFWVVIIDGIITFVMLAETLADMTFLGWSFWESGWHAFDFAVAFISLACWILMLLDYLSVTRSLDEFLTIILLCVRYAAQAFRIVRYLRSAAEATSVQAAVEEHEVRLDVDTSKSRGLHQHLGSLHSMGPAWSSQRDVVPGAVDADGDEIGEADSEKENDS